MDCHGFGKLSLWLVNMKLKNLTNKSDLLTGLHTKCCRICTNSCTHLQIV